MERIFLDTNILIDILTKRQPNFDESVKLLRSANDCIFTISSISVTNAYYIAKVKDQEEYRNFIDKFEIISLDKNIISQAFNLKMKDLEDAIQLATSLNYCKVFITWNKKDFKLYSNDTQILTPREFNHLNAGS